MSHRRRADICYVVGYGLIVVSVVLGWTHVFPSAVMVISACIGIVIAFILEPIILLIKGEE